MNKPTMNFDVPVLASLASAAAIALLAIPALASAQDPAVDQYAPSTPDGGGSVPAEPVPNADAGGTVNVPEDSGGGGSGGSGGNDPAATDAAGTATDPSDPSATSEATGGEPKNRDKDTVEGLAANAEEQREAAAAQTGADEAPATRLLRSDDGGAGGMGLLLWIVLGMTLAWAIATGINRRRQDGQPA